MYSQQILKQLHKIMRQDLLIKEISNAIGVKLEQLKNKVDDFKVQLDIDTATWALSIYEKELGITTNVEKPLSDRRSSIIARLRATGRTDTNQIKLIADSYTNGDVNVEFDQAIIINFTSTVGIPTNLDDLKTVLRNIVPAHLAIQYKIRYLMINETHNILTINQMQQTLLSKLAGRGN